MTKNSVFIQEVGFRDGLQSIGQVMATEDKLAWIDQTYACGIRLMEVASFVPPKLLPQMADAAAVVRHALKYPDLTVSALAPNLRGAENAFATGIHRLTCPISVSAAHSLSNVRKTPVQAVEEFRAIKRRSQELGAPIKIMAGLSTVFGCTLQGGVPLDDVLNVVRHVVDAGCDIITLADTVGYATPLHVEIVLEAVMRIAPNIPITAHFHDTRGMALANTLIALRQGITEFDASLAGLGGCPFAPGATGNIATEDLVFMLEAMGYRTDVSLPGLLSIRDLLQRAMPETVLHGNLAAAGLPKNFRTS